MLELSTDLIAPLLNAIEGAVGHKRRRELKRAPFKRLRSAGRLPTFEPLEDRLVLAGDPIPLSPAPAPDVLTLLPGPQPGQFEVTTGPAVMASLGRPWHAEFAGETLYQTAGT